MFEGRVTDKLGKLNARKGESKLSESLKEKALRRKRTRGGGLDLSRTSGIKSPQETNITRRGEGGKPTPFNKNETMTGNQAEKSPR